MYVWWIGVPNKIFPGAKTLLPIGVSPDKPPDLPGHPIFSQKFDSWYTENVIAPGLVTERQIKRALTRMWRAQRAVGLLMRDLP